MFPIGLWWRSYELISEKASGSLSACSLVGEISYELWSFWLPKFSSIISGGCGWGVICAILPFWPGGRTTETYWLKSPLLASTSEEISDYSCNEWSSSKTYLGIWGNSMLALLRDWDDLSVFLTISSAEPDKFTYFLAGFPPTISTTFAVKSMKS